MLLHTVWAGCGMRDLDWCEDNLHRCLLKNTLMTNLEPLSELLLVLDCVNGRLLELTVIGYLCTRTHTLNIDCIRIYSHGC